LDRDKRGRIWCIDVDGGNPRQLRSQPQLVLDLGEPGCFDDSGVNPSAIVSLPQGVGLYYIGWQRQERVPYGLFAGLAIRDNDGKFTRYQRTPILDRTDAEPFVRSATSVVKINNTLLCWYVSALKWTSVNGRPYPEYIIRHATSLDGIRWVVGEAPCLNFENPAEFGFGRPWVLYEGGRFRMWYSIRSRTEPYRLGYAESIDGQEWTRLDDRVSLSRSKDGWDSEMICYPCVVDSKGRRLLFYNGNSHGATGFGVAVLEQD
jgi:hypothetical protein